MASGASIERTTTPAGDSAWRVAGYESVRTLRMNGLRPRVQTLVDGLLDDMERRTPPVDLHEALSFPLPALLPGRPASPPSVSRCPPRSSARGLRRC